MKRAAPRSRQRGLLLNPFRFGGGGGGAEIAPTALAFTQTDNIDYLQLLAPELVDVDEEFVADAGQFSRYSEGTPGTIAVSGGKMTVTHAGGANDVIRQNSVDLAIPQCWVEAWIDVTSAGTSYDNGGVGLVKDANNFIFASIDRLAGLARIQIKIAGANNFLATVPQAFSAGVGLALSLVGTSACVWINTGTGWFLATSADVGAYYDFRNIGALVGWGAGFTTANGGGTQVWAFAALKMGRFGAVGLRDQSIVTLEDGSPYLPTPDSVLFTATAVDPRGIGYTGVFLLDLVARTIMQKAVIFVERGGKAHGDLPAHIIWYANGDRRITISTWANGFGGSIQALHGLLSGIDVLAGTHLVTLTPITLPGQTGANPGAYDTFAAYDAANSRWLIAYTLVENTNFAGNPFYAAAAWTTDWATFTLIGKDSTHNGYEGTKLLLLGGVYYVLAGGPAGAGNSSRVYDASMNYLGPLDAVFHGGSDTQPHPMVFPHGSKQVILTFNNARYASASFTWGDIEIYEAPRYA